MVANVLTGQIASLIIGVQFATNLDMVLTTAVGLNLSVTRKEINSEDMAAILITGLL